MKMLDIIAIKPLCRSDGYRFEAAQVQSWIFFFFQSSTFQTHFVQLIKSSKVLVRPTDIQALPSPHNYIDLTTAEKNYLLFPNINKSFIVIPYQL